MVWNARILYKRLQWLHLRICRKKINMVILHKHCIYAASYALALQPPLRKCLRDNKTLSRLQSIHTHPTSIHGSSHCPPPTRGCLGLVVRTWRVWGLYPLNTHPRPPETAGLLPVPMTKQVDLPSSASSRLLIGSNLNS